MKTRLEESLRLREAFVKCNITTKEAAAQIKYPEQKIRDLKNGKQKITPEIALELENVFKINAVWLIFGRGDIFIPKFDLEKPNATILSNDEILDTLKKREKEQEVILEELKQLRNDFKNRE